MARYASVCQVHGLVPIVEPDIDVVQGDHTIEKAAQVSEKVLAAFFKVLQAQLDIFTKKHLILGLCRNFYCLAVKIYIRGGYG